MNESPSPPEMLNVADYLLDARVREGDGGRVAVRTDRRDYTYRDIQTLANRYGNVLREVGVEPEQRVIIALPDGPEFVAALFGTLKIGAVVVMVNPHLRPHEIEYFYRYTRAVVAVVDREVRDAFAAPDEAGKLKALIVVDEPNWSDGLQKASAELETYPTHKDDAAIWLFSGGTTGRPKAVVQPHASYWNSTECYGKGVLGLTENDVTLSVPKLFFGYAMGSNLFFPFSVGATSVLFPERCTPDVMFAKIAKFHPTVLVNVPTMINQMVSHPDAANRDLSSLRAVTSAGEGLPVELYDRWRDTFGVELLDGLGTAEMWHIFISNRPGDVKPGTLGRVVPGFEVKVCDEDGDALPDGEMGWLWVRGGSRAVWYWQQLEKSAEVFRGEWYVSGDLVSRDAEGYFTYGGRADDLLKVSGKWLAPQEVESCLLQHAAVREVAVVGVTDADGLVVPHAFCVVTAQTPGLANELCAFVAERIGSYKRPRGVTIVGSLPRTHLGKVDRGKLQREGVSKEQGARRREQGG